MKDEPFDPNQLPDALNSVAILAQQQTIWARMGHMLERLLGMSRSITIIVGGDADRDVYDTPVTVEMNGNIRRRTETGFSVAEVLAILLGEIPYRRCHGPCRKMLPLTDFAGDAQSKLRWCKDCYPKSRAYREQQRRGKSCPSA